MLTQKTILIIAGILGALAVGLGAFGAHALKNLLELSERTDTYETAVKYHFYHVLALLAIALLMNRFNSVYLGYSAWSFIAGIFIFSGSLYVLCLTGITKLGAVTPIGGLAFIIGWVFLVLAAAKS